MLLHQNQTGIFLCMPMGSVTHPVITNQMQLHPIGLFTFSLFTIHY